MDNQGGPAPIGFEMHDREAATAGQNGAAGEDAKSPGDQPAPIGFEGVENVCCLTGRTMNHNLGMRVGDTTGPPPVERPDIGFEGLGRPPGTPASVSLSCCVVTLTSVIVSLTRY
ncbi:hypothetical protein NP493_1213g00006 [Ridgeia piscesae]|uniref:Uncharacterized protein n=1 Tax=Ridgeia piscesae TaxID=27915 RepID=A0AAD9KDT7_RIDPI|nr:hypothetical protein NP493_1213g00006 [Ridgeia piscesae]